MTALIAILPYIQIVLAVLLTVAILLQQTDAGMGETFGGTESTSTWRTRRGFEKVLFIGTIIISILFVASAVLALTIR